MSMEELLEKVKDALRRDLGEKPCEGCAYDEGRGMCDQQMKKDALWVIEVMDGERRCFGKAYGRLKQRLERAEKCLKPGVPPMPCDVGDALWNVCELDGVISVEKVKCTEILWNGEDWLVSSDGCSWDVPGEECVFLSIETAVKKAEEMLRNGNV